MADAGAGLAHARAALAGNPSDGYGGAVLAVTVTEFAASALVCEGPIEPPSELVEATVRRFAQELCAEAAGNAVRWKTSIPRAVGLGGSSAIVTATLRALCSAHRIELAPAELAALALAVETEELGIAAGLQDRVAQAYGGLTFMEFGAEPRYESLDPGLLPPLLVAWRVDSAQESGVVHGSLRARFSRGEGRVVEAMASLAGLAREARDALVSRDLERFARAVGGSFDVRRGVLPLDPRHVEVVECARGAGAAGVNYTGSGGAVVAVCADQNGLGSVQDALGALGCGVIRTGSP